MSIGFDIKKMFFDRTAVTDNVDRATRRMLSRFGVFVRTTARYRIRKRKKISQPGSPPSSHTGLLKQFIYFGYDPAQRSVVIGPVKLNAKHGDVPHILEYGGSTTIVRGRRTRRSRRATYRARPFMQPALEANEPKLPAMWRDSVK